MKILIAEDDPVFKKLLITILGDEGFQVTVKSNGFLAWQALQEEKEKPDLLILDVNMPVMDGFEVLQKVRSDERLKTLPVIMFTIKALNEDKIAGYDYGADDYITKPFDSKLFIAKVKTLARRTKKD